MEHQYTYLFIRSDLTPAQRIVQAAHAAHNAGAHFGEHSHMVCLAASSQPELISNSQYLDQQGIRYTMFHEPDDDTGYTAICTEPLTGDQRKPLRRFKLHKD